MVTRGAKLPAPSRLRSGRREGAAVRNVCLPVVTGLVLLLALPAHAGTVDTPQCRVDIERAMQIIRAVAAREKGPAVRTRDEVCRYHRLDLNDLVAVFDLAGPCLTEPERGKELQGLKHSIEITQRRINSQCRERSPR